MRHDNWMWSKLSSIQKYCTKRIDTETYQQGLVIEGRYLIAKKKTMFRPLGQLDWAWYTAKGLGTAIENDTLDHYYEAMLKDDRSPPNVWKRRHEEMEKKTYYAVRSGLAEFI